MLIIKHLGDLSLMYETLFHTIKKFLRHINE